MRKKNEIGSTSSPWKKKLTDLLLECNRNPVRLFVFDLCIHTQEWRGIVCIKSVLGYLLPIHNDSVLFCLIANE